MCTYTHTHTHTHTHTCTPSTQPLRCLTLCSLCTTYEQTWEMCKFFVDGRAKGEGNDSISRCPELTFTLVLACNTIRLVPSTIDPVNTLRLLLDLCLGTHTHTHTTRTRTRTHTYTQPPPHTRNTHTTSRDPPCPKPGAS